MPILTDEEFGHVTVRRTARGSGIRFSLAPNGSLRIAAPSYIPLFMVKRSLNQSRSDIRALLDTHPKLRIEDGMQVGKSHHLTIRREATGLSVRRYGNQLVATIPHHASLTDSKILDLIRPHIITALKREAKHYLPRRLKHLADIHGYEYTDVRFSHSSTRWGSCNSKKIISLNIALMNLSMELIDYVLLHELAHTREMNHSKAFWAHVAHADPQFAAHKKRMKSHSPSI